jgi:deazaflavin-dependent oxidoreductase (nitroreductase family)
MTNDRKRPGQATRAFNRFAGRVAGKRAMPVWALVHHVGRTSGKSYATPVAVFPAPGAFYVALPWGRGTDWVRNLRAAGGGTMAWKGTTYDVSEPTFVDKGEVLGIADPFRRQVLKRWPLADFLRVRRVPAGRL